MNLDIFTAKGIASQANVSSLSSYEDETSHYREQDYTYIPMPKDGKYFHVIDNEIRDIEDDQYLHPDTSMLDAFSKLQEYPFLLFDEFMSFEHKDGEFQASKIREIDLMDESVSMETIAESPDRFREEYYEEPWHEIIDTIEQMDPERYWILTLADANKRRARELFYRVLSEFEVQLAQMVKRKHPDSESLFGEAKPEAIGRWQKSKIDGLVVHISEHMYLSTLMKIVGKSDSLREEMGYTSRNEFDDDLGALNNLRHRIMHPTKTLVHNAEDLAKEVSRIERAVEALERLDRKEVQPDFPESDDHF